MKATHFRILAAVLAVALFVALGVGVYAANPSAATKDGVTVVLSTDKESYTGNATVKVSLDISNNSGKEATIYSKINVPSGMEVSSGSTSAMLALKSGESNKQEVTLDIDKPSDTGDSMQLGLWIVLFAVSACGMAVLIIFGKNGKSFISLVICLVLVGSVAFTAVPAQAEGLSDELTVTRTIKIDDADVTITAVVNYVLAADDSGETEDETHDHVWVEATCTAPKTCSVCGQTEGEALGHNWVNADCDTPKTCSVCGKTEGEALGHSWVDADCDTPKTCSVCGETEGEALGHVWVEADCDTPRTCSVCGETACEDGGEPKGHTWVDATCTAPKTCSVCGETMGEALGHSWADATCTTPKTCSVCGQTEGEALGHSWEAADCDTPKTCSVCGETEGEALGHRWQEADLTNPKTCVVCGKTEGLPIGSNAIGADGVYTRAELEDALVATAWAYYLKEAKIQYCSQEITEGLNKYTDGSYRLTEDASPEFGTSDTTIYSVCSDFVYKMYYEALGHRLFGAENYLGATTSDFWMKSEDVALFRWIKSSYTLSKIDEKYGVTTAKQLSTEKAREFVANWKENLRPGDVIVATGHALVYVGNGYVMDCWGSKYDESVGLEREELGGSVHCLHTIEDLMLDGDDPVAGAGYKIYDNSDKNWFVIFRPLDAFVSEKSETNAGEDIIDLDKMIENGGDADKNIIVNSRLEYPAMEIDRTVNVTPYGTVSFAEQLTYTISIRNMSNDPDWLKMFESQDYQDLLVTETIPEGTTLMQGSITHGGTYQNGKITWNLDIAAGEQVELSYRVMVIKPEGYVIVNDGGYVAGIPSNSLTNVVGGAELSESAQEGLAGLAATDKSQWREKYNISCLGTDLEFAERVYQAAMGIDLDLPTVQEILDNLFVYEHYKNESCSDRYPETMETDLYALNQEVTGEWQTIADMMVSGYYGGQKLFSERGLTMNEFSIDYLEVGDILVYASVKDADGSVTGTRIMVYAGKNADGKGVMLSMISEQASNVFVGSSNNNADILHTMLWKALAEDIFFVLRPSQAYDDINTLVYDEVNEPTYGEEPAQRKEGLQIGNGYSAELDQQYLDKLAALTAAGWTQKNTNFAEEVYKKLGLDIVSATKSNSASNMLKGDVFFESVGTSSNYNYELQAVVAGDNERMAAMVVTELRGGPDMVGYTDNLITIDDLKPGDVLNLVNRGKSMYWVCVYLGDGKLLVSEYATKAPSGKYQTYQVYDFSDDTDGSKFAEFITKDAKDGVAWQCYFVTRPSWGFENINDCTFDPNTIEYIPGLQGFEQITSAQDVEDGYYVIAVCYEGQYYFVTNATGANALTGAAATVENGLISADNLQYWCINVTSGTPYGPAATISCASGYAYQAAKDTATINIGALSSSNTRWTIIYDDETASFRLQTSSGDDRYLMYVPGNTYFKAYASDSENYPQLLLFKWTGKEPVKIVNKSDLTQEQQDALKSQETVDYANSQTTNNTAFATNIYNQIGIDISQFDVNSSNSVNKIKGELFTESKGVYSINASSSAKYANLLVAELTGGSALDSYNAIGINDLHVGDILMQYYYTSSLAYYNVSVYLGDGKVATRNYVNVSGTKTGTTVVNDFNGDNGLGFDKFLRQLPDGSDAFHLVWVLRPSILLNADPLPDISGEYVLAVRNGDKYYALTNTTDGYAYGSLEITVENGKVTTANVDSWKLSVVNAGIYDWSVTLQGTDGKYLARKNGSSNMPGSDAAENWTLTYDETTGCYRLLSVNGDSRYLTLKGTTFKSYPETDGDFGTAKLPDFLLIPVGGDNEGTGGETGGETETAYTQVTEVENVTSGEYLVVVKVTTADGTKYYAMDATIGTYSYYGNCFCVKDITEAVTTDAEGKMSVTGDLQDHLWTLTAETAGDATTVYLNADGGYLAHANSSNLAFAADKTGWTLGTGDGYFTLTLSGRKLMYESSRESFWAFSSTNAARYESILLFKLAEG